MEVDFALCHGVDCKQLPSVWKKCALIAMYLLLSRQENNSHSNWLDRHPGLHANPMGMMDLIWCFGVYKKMDLIFKASGRNSEYDEDWELTDTFLFPVRKIILC